MSDAATASLAPWVEWFTRPLETVAAELDRFRALLEKWQAAQNLVSRETLEAFWSRHVANSLQALPLLPVGPGAVFDLGSGGGFPGLPLAVAKKGSGLRFVLCEANQKKVAFLRTAIRELRPEAEVRAGRIEALDPREAGAAEIVVSRAFAPLNLLFEMAFPLLKPEGKLVLHKGRENGREIETAALNWQFDVVRHHSRTDQEGVLLEISALVRRPRSG